MRRDAGTAALKETTQHQQLALPGIPSTPVASPIAPMPPAWALPTVLATADAAMPGKPAEVLALEGGRGESLVALGIGKSEAPPAPKLKREAPPAPTLKSEGPPAPKLKSEAPPAQSPH